MKKFPGHFLPWPQLSIFRPFFCRGHNSRLLIVAPVEWKLHHSQSRRFAGGHTILLLLASLKTLRAMTVRSHQICPFSLFFLWVFNFHSLLQSNSSLGPGITRREKLFYGWAVKKGLRRSIARVRIEKRISVIDCRNEWLKLRGAVNKFVSWTKWVMRLHGVICYAKRNNITNRSFTQTKNKDEQQK